MVFPLSDPNPARGSSSGSKHLIAAIDEIAQALSVAYRQLDRRQGELTQMRSAAVTAVSDVLGELSAKSKRLCKILSGLQVKVERYGVLRSNLAADAKRVRQATRECLQHQQQSLRKLQSLSQALSGSATGAATSGSGPILPTLPTIWSSHISTVGLDQPLRVWAERWNSERLEIKRLVRKWQRLQSLREKYDRQLSAEVSAVADAVSRVQRETTKLRSMQVPLAQLAPHSVRPDLLVSALLSLNSAGSVAEVRAAWLALSATERQRLIEKYPQVIGPLDGVDTASRHSANILAAQHALNDPMLDDNTKTGIRRLLASLSANHQPPRALLKFALTDDTKSDNGRAMRIVASVAIGDIDNAGTVTFAGFGMNSSAGRPESSLRGISNLVVAANSKGANTAAIAWWGYDPPVAIEEPFIYNARDGGRQLAQDVDKFIESSTHPVRIVGFAHSYGSLNWIEALRHIRNKDRISAFVTAGAPGLQHDAPQVLGTIPGYALNAGGDAVADMGFALSALDRKLPIYQQLVTAGGENSANADAYLNIRTTLPGFTEISAETGTGSATTSHSLIPSKTDKTERGYLSKGTSALAGVSGLIAAIGAQPSGTTDSQAKRDGAREHHPDAEGQPQVRQAQVVPR